VIQDGNDGNDGNDGGDGGEALRDGIGRALSRLPSGLYVLTAGAGAGATGMLSSWVQQVGFEPPALVVALKKGRPIEALLRSQDTFCLSVIDDDSKSLVAHFARGFEPGTPAFDGIDTSHTEQGTPYPTAAHAHLVCRRVGIADNWTDHTVICGEVIGGEGRLDAQPLVHIRKSGFSY